MNLPRLYYTLPELVEKWKKTEDDLLHMAAAGELELSVYHYSSGLRTVAYPGIKPIVDCVQIHGYVQLFGWQVESILNHGFKRTIISSVSMNGNHVDLRSDGAQHRFKAAMSEVFTEGYNGDLPHDFDARPVELKSSTELLILPDEVTRVEARFPELAMAVNSTTETDDNTHKETSVQGCILYDIPSQVELAKMCGVTPKTVSNWTKKNLLTKEVPGAGLRYSKAATVEWLEQNSKHKELKSFNNSK